MALTIVGSSLVPLVRDMAFKKNGSGFPACLASSSYFSRPVACSRGSGIERSALRLEVTARPRLEPVDTSLERFLAKRDMVGSAAGL